MAVCGWIPRRMRKGMLIKPPLPTIEPIKLAKIPTRNAALSLKISIENVDCVKGNIYFYTYSTIREII
jgi:hypothetical protein